METAIELPNREALIAHVAHDLAHYDFFFAPEDLKIEFYAIDKRIDWPATYIVTLKDYGVVGFTDGPGEAVP
jgi:hypothetical protein